LKFKELIALQLKSGSRPTLLVDVLRSARAVGGDAQLIIEIKPGNSAAASALSRLLRRNPGFMPFVAAIMSFDFITMHRLKKELYHQQQQRNGSFYRFSSAPTFMSLQRLQQAGHSETGR
jgi:hypothetical protein